MVKQIVTGLILFCLVSFITTGCYKDNEEDLYPSVSDCDTVSVSYTQNVLPILESFCYSCHKEANHLALASGINLEGYDNVMVKVEDGYLLSAITHDGNASFMPKNGNKLADCNIALIRNWINEGALNN